MINIFWISTAILIYHLFGYGILLKILSSFKRNKASDGVHDISDYPTITILCPAFNEEAVLEEKIQSFYGLNYPKDKIKMIVISDDSTDRTNDIVEKYIPKGQLELVIQKPRRGKQCGHNLVEPSLTSDYVLSTDANSIFQPDAIKQLLAVMLSDPKIGIVSGTLKLLAKDGKDSGEGIYWKYESFLKKQESKLFSIIGSNGALFLIKRELFTQVEAASVDDFERTLIALKRGFKAKYAPNAIVHEDVSTHANEEIGRKVRIIAQEWFAIGRQKAVFKRPVISFMLISHKLIRWSFPLFSIGILISSLLMIIKPVFLVLSISQVLGYLLGFIQLTINKRETKNKILNLAAYITAMNYSAIGGFIQFLKGKQYATWNTIREEK